MDDIRFIEHYVNEMDPISRLGVLRWMREREHNDNCFAGRLFERKGKGGHMFVQHYLRPMFTSGNQFMDQPYSKQMLKDPDQTEDMEEICDMKTTVRQLSRLAAYLDGGRPYK